MPICYVSSNLGRQRVRETARQQEASCGNLRLRTRAQNAQYTGDRNDYVLGDPCSPFVKDFGTQSLWRAATLGCEEAGPGGGGRAGPQPRARHAAPKRQQEAAAGADPSLPAAGNCGCRPAAPRPPPPHQARLPARLSVSSLPPYWTARAHFRPRIFGIDLGRGAREQVAVAGQLGRQPGVPEPVSRRPCRQPSPGHPLPARGGARRRPDFAPPRALLLRARGRARCGRRPGPRPNMAEVSIDQSKLPGVKEGRARGVRRAGASPLPAGVLSRQGSRHFGGRVLARSPPCAGLSWPCGEWNLGSSLVPSERHLDSKPHFFTL